jgi:hypothetical protein
MQVGNCADSLDVDPLLEALNPALASIRSLRIILVRALFLARSFLMLAWI